MTPYADAIQNNNRIGGALLHPTSLPSGKLDADVFYWLDFLAASGLQAWQVLPLGEPQSNLSPYQCYSAFALNPALLTDSIIPCPKAGTPDAEALAEWVSHESYWVQDYALFTVLKTKLNNQPWFDWPAPYRQHNTDALKDFSIQHQEQITAVYWQQYQLYTRWHEVTSYAHQRGIYLFGDMPIFVAHDSADVWAKQDEFLIDELGQPNVVTGVPPDYFSETGQRWGNPHYNWEVMQERGFSWWIQRIKNHLALFDLVRIDHFRGLEAAWSIDATCETAIEGYWQEVPGDALLQQVQDQLGNIAIVAEDLGIITDKVNALRKKYELPGMSVLQFSFDSFDDNPHKPKNITHDRIVYTGTHDNDTSLGWLLELQESSPEQYSAVLDSLDSTEPEQAVYALIESAFESQGQLAIVPLQDFLLLDNDSRMNIPGTSDGNWTWKFKHEQLEKELSEKIHSLLCKHKRCHDEQ